MFEPVGSTGGEVLCVSFDVALECLRVAGGVAGLDVNLSDDLVPLIEPACDLASLLLKRPLCLGAQGAGVRLDVDDPQRVPVELPVGFLACLRDEVDGGGAGVVVDVRDGADVVTVVGADVQANCEVGGVVFEPDELAGELISAGPDESFFE